MKKWGGGGPLGVHWAAMALLISGCKPRSTHLSTLHTFEQPYTHWTDASKLLSSKIECSTIRIIQNPRH